MGSACFFCIFISIFSHSNGVFLLLVKNWTMVDKIIYTIYYIR